MTGVVLSLFTGILPMVIYAVLLTWFDRYEKEPPLLMIGVFLWGAIVAAGSALIINTAFDLGLIFLTGSESVASIGAAVISAPIVEEAVKGLAVLGVFIFFRSEFDSLLDGVIYGSLVGFGFAAAENVNYIFSGYAEAGIGGLVMTAFIRSVVIGFLHATLTSFTGLGLAVARLNKGWLRWVAPLGGYAAAVGLHAFHNALASLGNLLICLLGSVFDWIGFVGMFGLILILIWREGRIVRQYLTEEVRLGLLTPGQLNTAASLIGQTAARWSALGGGRWLKTERFYDICGRLAFKNYQLAQVGAEPGLQQSIDRLRGELARLNQGA